MRGIVLFLLFNRKIDGGFTRLVWRVENKIVPRIHKASQIERIVSSAPFVKTVGSVWFGNIRDAVERV